MIDYYFDWRYADKGRTKEKKGFRISKEFVCALPFIQSFCAYINLREVVRFFSQVDVISFPRLPGNQMMTDYTQRAMTCKNHKYKILFLFFDSRGEETGERKQTSVIRGALQYRRYHSKSC